MAKKPSKYPPVPEGHKLVCTPYKTLPNGTRVHASQFGKKAFCWVEPIETVKS